MKLNLPHIFLVGIVFITMSVQAQVGINTTTPDASSALDIQSSEAGVLIPRMSTLQRQAISSPAASLLVFDTDLNNYYYNSGNSTSPNWIPLLSERDQRDNFKLVKSTSDLAEELTNGGGSTYLLQEDFLYEFNGTIAIDFPIDMNGAYLIGKDTNEDVLVNATSGALFQSTSSGGSIRNLHLNGNGNTIFNLSGNQTQNLVINNTLMSSASSVGTLTNLNTVFFSITQFVNNSDGLVASDINSYFFNLSYWDASNTGTYQTLSGDFVDIQFESGRIIADTGETGLDVSANPSVGRSGVISSVTFDGDGTRVQPYTTGTYIGYNFTNDWQVNAPGIIAEADNLATGDLSLDAAIGSGFNTNFSSNQTPTKLNGTTTSDDLFRFEAGTSGGTQIDNRLVYMGTKSRRFKINASVSFQATGTNSIFVFYLAKGDPGASTPTVVEETKVYSRAENLDVEAVSFNGSLLLEPGGYIEIWAERYTGSGDLLTVSMNLVAN